MQPISGDHFTTLFQSLVPAASEGKPMVRRTTRWVIADVAPVVENQKA